MVMTHHWARLKEMVLVRGHHLFFFCIGRLIVEVGYCLLSGAPICVFLYQFIITFAIQQGFPNICIYVVVFLILHVFTCTECIK